MKQKIMIWLMTIIMLASASPCLADGQDKQNAPAVEEIKARVTEAKAKGYRLTVKLTPDGRFKLGGKPGASMSGKVVAITDDSFEIVDTSPLNADIRATILYSETASVKRQNAVGKVFKNIGEYSLLAAIVPVMIVSSLIGHPLYDC